MRMTPRSRKIICKACADLEAAITRYIEKADDDMSDELGKAGYVDPDGTVNKIDDLEGDLEDALDEETDEIVNDLGQATSADDLRSRWGKLKAKSTTANKIAIAYEKNMSDTIMELSDLYLKETCHDMRVTSLTKRTTDWIHSWAEDLGKLMQLTSHEQIERVLADGLENGDDIQTITRAIQDAGIRESYGRARTTAITEVLAAHNVAHQEAQTQNPVVSQKMWRHSGAYRIAPRPNHVDMDGQVVDVDQPFTLVGSDGNIYYPMYPCDTSLPAKERINCHCLSQDVVDQDVLAMSLADRKKLQQKAIDDDDGEWEAELDAQNKAKAGIEEE